MIESPPELNSEIIAALSDSDSSRRNLPMTIMIGKCLGCARRLPWPSPKPGFWASPASCPECGRWYYTETHNHVTPVIRVGDQHTPHSLANQYAAEGMSRVNCLLAPRLPGEDRRSDERREVRVYLPAVPLNASLESPCEVTEVRLLNLSPAGCCLQLSEPLAVAYLLLDFSVVGLPGYQALAAVRWLETDARQTRVGCKFLFSPGGDLPIDVE